MPELKYTGDRPYRSRGIGRVEPGQIEVVSGELADHLLGRGDWKTVESDGHECETCGQSFDTPQGLGAHKRVHS